MQVIGRQHGLVIRRLRHVHALGEAQVTVRCEVELRVDGAAAAKQGPNHSASSSNVVVLVATEVPASRRGEDIIWAAMSNESSSWPLWPVHGGKPLPSDHTELAFEDLAAPVHDRVVSDVFPSARVCLCAEGAQRPRRAGARGRWLHQTSRRQGRRRSRRVAPSLGFHAFVLVHRFPWERFGSQAPVTTPSRRCGSSRSRGRVRARHESHRRVRLSSGGHLAACLVARYPARMARAGLSARARQPSPGLPDRRLRADLHERDRPHDDPRQAAAAAAGEAGAVRSDATRCAAARFTAARVHRVRRERSRSCRWRTHTACTRRC